MGSRHFALACLAVALSAVYYNNYEINLNFLTNLSENLVLGSMGVHLSIAGFCLAIPKDSVVLSSGEIDEDDYTKQSIYALLYSTYAFAGDTQMPGANATDSFTFTFNTWGFGPSLYGDDPQRFGKTAYGSLMMFDSVKQRIAEFESSGGARSGETLRILEIGSGTGAGANHISSTVISHGNVQYTALDMQLAATQTCEKRHAAHNDKMECVQGNGQSLPFEDDTFDIVLVCETHIAEYNVIDGETRRVLEEMKRVLKPQGMFVWGNAIRTDVWNAVIAELPNMGFESCGADSVQNRTADAVRARDEDADRVEAWFDGVVAKTVMRFSPTCDAYVRSLFYNFCRQPGTDLYETMVNGTDSYLQICNVLTDK